MLLKPTPELIPQFEAMCAGLTFRNSDVEKQATATALRLYDSVGRYIAFCAARCPLLPPVFVMIAHERECSGWWGGWLGNGDSIAKPSVNFPPNHGPFATWEDGAIDALRYEGLDREDDWNRGKLCYKVIGYNGWGYLYHGILASPYAFAGTTLQVPGKYTADSHFDPSVMDTQIGAMAIYQKLAELDPGLALP